MVQEAEALMRRIEMEQKANALLEEAMTRRDLNALTNAIAGCDRMVPPLRHARLDEAREMMVRGERGREGEGVSVVFVWCEFRVLFCAQGGKFVVWACLGMGLKCCCGVRGGWVVGAGAAYGGEEGVG